MSIPITLADLAVVGERFKSAIRAAGTSARKLEPTLGVSSGSLGRMYKGKYPLRQELLEAFAAEVSADAHELVAGTCFSVHFGYVTELPEPEPAPEPTPAPQPPRAKPSPPVRLDSERLSMNVPFEEQLTLNDEFDDDDDDLKSTQDAGGERIRGPVFDEGVLVELQELSPRAAPPVAPAPPPATPAAEPPANPPAEDHSEDITEEPADEPPEEPAEDKGLLSSLTSRIKGLFG